MATPTDKTTADIKALVAALVAAGDPASLATAAKQLIAQVEKQSRQLNRLVKLSDATEERLMKTNGKLGLLTANLSRFVPPTVVDRLMVAEDLQIGRKDRRELTVFFSDIVGFTAMTEQMEPEHLSSLLVDYFSEMNRLCERWGVTLDQFIGDAIVIFFGAPESQGSEADARLAVGMALEMQDRLCSLRVKWADLGHSIPLHVRIGLATGYATVGNFGSDRRMHYTAIGNAVNEAARIQSLCEPGKVYIGEDTYMQVRDSFSTTVRDKVRLRGQQKRVQLYEVNLTQGQRTDDLIIGSGDGYRVFVDFEILANNEAALTLLKKAVEQLELTMKDGVNSRPKHAPESKTTPTMTNRDLPKGVKQA